MDEKQLTRVIKSVEDAGPSPALIAARRAWVDEVVDRPRKAFEFLSEYMAPQPVLSSEADPRMRLTTRDMPKHEPAWPNGVKVNLPLIQSSS